MPGLSRGYHGYHVRMVNFQHASLIREARQLFAEDRINDGRAACQQLLKLRKNDPEALILLAHADYKDGEHQKAVTRMQRYVRLYPKDIDGRDYLAWMLVELGRNREAIVQYDKLLKLKPDYPKALAGKSRAYDRDGRPEKGIKLLESYFTPGAGRATHGMALAYATCAMNMKDHRRAIDAAAPFVANRSDDRVTDAALWFVLGQCHERLDEIDKAFEAYTNANTINARPFDPDAFERDIDDLIELFSKDRLERLPRAETNSQAPVFISCLPRSGSTLIERILAAHPAVHPVGELNTLIYIGHDMQIGIGSTEPYPRCILDADRDDLNSFSKRYLDELKRHNRTARRYTNKNLFVWKQLMLVELFFPRARVIDIRRNRIDHAMACYFIDVGPDHPYAFRLDHLARVRRGYERLMEHWHEALSVPMLRVEYEDVVDEPERWSRRMIDFIGLEWDDAVLEFHQSAGKKGSDKPTLSYAQVRQPIYKTSVGRAEKFRPYIGELIEALGEAKAQS